MPHYYPVVFPAGRSLAGDSLGFHAYSFRVDNCTNQWYLEESTVSYIPPYSLGMCLRLYGTGVAILLAQAPVGQPQLAPIPGEQVVGVYSDQLRTEVAASPIRNFALVQTVSDFQQGAQPATPPIGTTRMWADGAGNLHRLLPSGQDATIVDSSNVAGYVSGATLGADLYGTVSAGHVGLRNNSGIWAYDSGGTLRNYLTLGTEQLYWAATGGGFRWVNQANSVQWMALDTSGNLTLAGNATVANTVYLNAAQTAFVSYDGTFLRLGAPSGSGVVNYLNTYYFANNGGVFWSWNGTFLFSSHSIVNNGNAYYLAGTAAVYVGAWDGSSIYSSHPLRIANGSNSPGAYLSMPARVGNQICMYDAGSGNCFGFGVNNSETAIFTGGGSTTVGFRIGSYNGSLFAHFESAGNLVLDGANSTLYMHNNKTVYIQQNYPYFDVVGNTLRLQGSAAGQSLVVSTHAFLSGVGYYAVVGGTNNNGQSFYCAGGAGGPTGWQIISSRRWKSNLVPIDNALRMVLDTAARGYHYTLDAREDEAREPRDQYGFIGEEWLGVAPDAVDLDDEGEVRFMDYGQITPILFEAFRQFARQTESRLAALEARV